MSRRAPAPPYFAGPVVDFLMMGGASIALFLLLLPSGKTVEGAGAALTALSYFSLSWLVNGAHFSATNYRLYRSRETVSQYPLTAGVAPLLALAGVLASLRRPAEIAPYFIKLYLLWSPYHYSGQTKGLTMLYARRAGFDPGPAAWKALTGLVFGTFLVSAARAEARLDRPDFFGIPYPTLGVPVWAAHAAEIWLALCAAAFLYYAARWARAEKRAPPLIVLVPALAQFLWFVPGRANPDFLGLIPFFHGLQYMLVAWFLQMQERLAEDGGKPRPRRLALETVWWTGANVAGYFLLFWILPKVLGSALGAPDALVGPLAIAAVQIHHFFVDGVIWKLRSPTVRAPLLAPLGEAAA
jgi:hypothetical protein